MSEGFSFVLKSPGGKKGLLWDTSTSSTYTIYHISSGAQSEPICQKHSTVPIERTKNVRNTMDGVSIMLIVCKRLDQGPRSRLGSRGLSPGTFSDLLNGSFFQIAQKCNKKSPKKMVPPLAPAHFLRLWGPCFESFLTRLR